MLITGNFILLKLCLKQWKLIKGNVDILITVLYWVAPHRTSLELISEGKNLSVTVCDLSCSFHFVESFYLIAEVEHKYLISEAKQYLIGSVVGMQTWIIPSRVFSYCILTYLLLLLIIKKVSLEFTYYKI